MLRNPVRGSSDPQDGAGPCERVRAGWDPAWAGCPQHHSSPAGLLWAVLFGAVTADVCRAGDKSLAKLPSPLAHGVSVFELCLSGTP